MYKVFINHTTFQWERRSFGETVEAVAAAHRNGDTWNVKRLTGRGGEYRPLTEGEATDLVEAVREELLS